MKKNLIMYVSGFLLALVSVMGSSAQYLKGRPVFNKDVLSESAKTLVNSEEADKFALASLKESNIRAYKDFTRFFKNASDIRLSTTTSGIFVSCMMDGIRNRVSYNSKGRWIHTIRHYGEQRLPSDVGNLVKGEYPGFAIFGVTEVNVGNKKAHLVSIENSHSWKRIKVVDGEMEVYEAYDKH